MSFINEKRQKFATALERARHSSTSSISSNSSTDEFNTSLSISLDSLDAFSDPFSSEISECFFNDENLGNTFNPTKWSSSPSAIDSLPTTLELCEWYVFFTYLRQVNVRLLRP